MTTRVVCWNIAKRHAPWRELVAMDADVALLQEAGQVPQEIASKIEIASVEFPDDLYDRWPMVVKLSDRVEVEQFKPVGPMEKPAEGEIAVSDVSTIAAARVTPRDAPPFIAVSMYARWIMPHSSTGTKWQVGHSDGSAHRIISDLSAFIGNTDPSTHRILAAGDLNIIYGTTYSGWQSTTEREQTVWSRIDTASSTGGCDRSAMMAGQQATQPTGEGFQYGTAFVSRRARWDRGDGPGGARRGAHRAAAGQALRDGAAGTGPRRRP